MGGLMSWESDENSFENRGIFRNPETVLDGQFKGISMLLHAYSAWVWERSGKQTFRVRPLKVMREIIERSISAENIRRTPSEPEDLIEIDTVELIRLWETY